MFQVIGYESKKCYFKGYHSECSRFIQSKSYFVAGSKKVHRASVSHFGFDEPLRILEVLENEKI